MTNCPNCGAPVDITADKCAYCDTYYSTIPEAEKTHSACEDVDIALRMGIITQNEARRRMGLEPIESPEINIKPLPMIWSD